MPIQRLTFFKVHDPADISSIIASYDFLRENNAREDRKPYILEVKSYPTIEDPRSQGFRVVSMLKFASLDDMKYYDTECETHKKLKELNTSKVDLPVVPIYFEVEA